MARKPRLSNSRSARWGRALGAAKGLLDQIETLMDELKNGPMEELRGLKDEYEEWQGNMPENFANSSLGEKLQAVCDLDFDAESLEDITEVLETAEGLDLPQGFGRD